MTATIPSVSREYLWVPVSTSGVDADQLTTLPVEMAFMADASEPSDGDWHAAEWAETATSATARLLIGDGPGVELPEGRYAVWIRVTGAIERPVRQAGRLKIT